MQSKYIIQIDEHEVSAPVAAISWLPFSMQQLPFRHCFLLLSKVELKEDGSTVTSPLESIHGLATKKNADGTVSKVKRSELFNGGRPLPADMEGDVLVPEISDIGKWNDYLQVYHIKFPPNQFGNYWLDITNPLTVYEKGDSLAIWQAASHQNLLEKLNNKLVAYSTLGVGGGGGILPSFDWMPALLSPTINSNSVFNTMFRIMLGAEPPQLSYSWQSNALRPGIQNLMVSSQEIEALRSEFVLTQNTTDEDIT